MLYINYDEGSFEFHVNGFRPTKEVYRSGFAPFSNMKRNTFFFFIIQGRPLLSCKHGELVALYVSWNFYESKLESKTSIRPPPVYNYDSSHIYVVSINKHFLARLHNVC